MGWSPRCVMPSFVAIGLLVLEKKIFEGFFTIYRRGDHLDHVTPMPWTNFRSPYPRMLHIKFGFDRPSGFVDLWVLWQTDGRRTMGILEANKKRTLLMFHFTPCNKPNRFKRLTMTCLLSRKFTTILFYKQSPHSEAMALGIPMQDQDQVPSKANLNNKVQRMNADQPFTFFCYSSSSTSHTLDREECHMRWEEELKRIWTNRFIQDLKI